MTAVNTISRASPVIRDSSVVTPTTAVLRKKPRFMSRGGLEVSWGRHGTEAAWRIAGRLWANCRFPLASGGPHRQNSRSFLESPACGQYQVSREACPSDREAPCAQRGGPVQAA